MHGKTSLAAAVAVLLLTISLVHAQAPAPAARAGGAAPPGGAAPAAPTTLPASADTTAAALQASPRHGEWVEVTLPGTDTKLRSFIVFPERQEKAGVVIVIHEIFGMTDWVRAVADQLAHDGFIAIAPDLLSGMGPNGGGTDSFPEGGARGAIGRVTPDEQVKRLNAVRDYGMKLPASNGKTAVIGFCWGGRASFNYATQQPQLNAAIVYYGDPPAADTLSKIQAPVLGLYGQNDARITQTVEPTKKAMTDLNKTYEAHVYDGAGHGFLRQRGTGGAGPANQKATEQAWPTTIAFLKKHLE